MAMQDLSSITENNLGLFVLYRYFTILPDNLRNVIRSDTDCAPSVIVLFSFVQMWWRFLYFARIY